MKSSWGGAIKDYVIEQTSYDDTDLDGRWYRLWKSGWLEQGCKTANKLGDFAAWTFPFLKEYKDTRFTFTLGWEYCSTSEDDGTWNGAITVRSKTTTSLQIYTRGAKSNGRILNCYCCGWAKNKP